MVSESFSLTYIPLRGIQHCPNESFSTTFSSSFPLMGINSQISSMAKIKDEIASYFAMATTFKILNRSLSPI